MRVFLVFITWISFYSTSWAGEKLTIVTDIWPPYVTIEAGNIGGSSTKIVEKSLKGSGIEYEIIRLPWARAYEMAQNKKNIAIYTIVRTENREHLFQWIAELHPANSIFFYGFSHSKGIPDTLEELKKHSISVVRQSMSLESLQKEGFPSSGILMSVEEFDAIRLTMMGRADYVATSEQTMTAFKALHPEISEKVVKGPELLSKPLFFALNKNSDTQLIRRVTAAFQKNSKKSLTN